MKTNLPQLATAVMSWSNKMQIGIVCKSQENFKTVESILYGIFSAVMQPLQVKQIMIKPEGQRAWKWYWLHAETKLQLQIDDIVILEDDRSEEVV
jgi:hypothetical protein